LTRNETKDERLWKEIGEEVRKDTDKLFKMIGEAYAVLSDPAKVKISSPITILSSVFVFS
jgi:DnaJ family protein C protein 7